MTAPREPLTAPGTQVPLDAGRWFLSDQDRPGVHGGHSIDIHMGQGDVLLRHEDGSSSTASFSQLRPHPIEMAQEAAAIVERMAASISWLESALTPTTAPDPIVAETRRRVVQDRLSDLGQAARDLEHALDMVHMLEGMVATGD